MSSGTAINGGFVIEDIHGNAGTDHIVLDYSGTLEGFSAEYVTLRLRTTSNEFVRMRDGITVRNESFHLRDFESAEVTGSSGNDTIELLNGNDIARGGDGSDVITGYDGDDQLFGGAGNDILNGGRGNDIFVVRANSDHDALSDFEQGEDLINVYGFSVGAVEAAIADFNSDVTQRIELGSGSEISL